MSPWIPVGITVLLFVLGTALTFYNRFYPDVDVQKRHLKKLGTILFNTAIIGVQISFIHNLGYSGQPVTSGFVVRVALVVGAVFYTVSNLAFSYFLDRLLTYMKNEAVLDDKRLDLHRNILDMFRQQNKINASHTQSLVTLSQHVGFTPAALIELKDQTRDRTLGSE